MVFYFSIVEDDKASSYEVSSPPARNKEFLISPEGLSNLSLQRQVRQVPYLSNVETLLLPRPILLASCDMYT
jgi:hypothetical protein